MVAVWVWGLRGEGLQREGEVLEPPRLGAGVAGLDWAVGVRMGSFVRRVTYVFGITDLGRWVERVCERVASGCAEFLISGVGLVACLR